MANSLQSNVSQIVLKKFCEEFKSDVVLLNTVNRQIIEGEINSNTGDTVWLKRPMQFKSVRTPAGDLSGMPTQDMIAGKVPAKISNYVTVEVAWSQLEEAIYLNQLDELLRPVAAKMASELEQELARFIMANGALTLGAPGTAITKWSDIAAVGAYLKDLGVDSGTNYAVISPWDSLALADAQSSIQSDNLVQTAWTQAKISKPFGGVQALMSNALAARQTGSGAGATGMTVSATPVATYDSVKDTFKMTITLAGATGKTIKAGDILEFTATSMINQHNKNVLFRDGVPVKYTAVASADATVAGDIATVVVSGPAVVDANNPQYNTVSGAVVAGAAVSIKGTASSILKPALFFNSDAFAMGSVVLPKLHATESSVMKDARSGFSFRVHKFSDGRANKQFCRFDCLPSFACLLPFAGGQLFGQA